MFFHFAVATHFILRVDPHCHVEEILIQERDAGFHTPCGHGFVGASAVKHMQRLQFAHRFFMQFFGIWCFMEVQVTAEDFVRAFA
ncbi:hypothetical protein D3C72_1629500 [compost metagenome]